MNTVNTPTPASSHVPLLTFAPPPAVMTTSYKMPLTCITEPTTQQIPVVQNVSPAATPLPCVRKRTVTSTELTTQPTIDTMTPLTPAESTTPSELPSPKRTRMNLTKEIRDADIHAQHIMLASAIDKLVTKIDKVEASLKAKLKEVCEAQTHDLCTRIQQGFQNVFADEVFHYKQYNKSLVSALQDNLLQLHRK